MRYLLLMVLIVTCGKPSKIYIQDPAQPPIEEPEQPPSDEIFQLTNKFRASQGIGPLTYSPEWSYAATEWSRKMATSGVLSHDGFPTERIASLKSKYPAYDTTFASGGENILWNQSGTAKSMVDQWISSPPHRENMLRAYDLIGTGTYEYQGRYYGTQIFIKEKF